MLILGLNSHELNSSAAFLKNGEVAFASNEERFNRKKLTKEFPIKSVEYYLKKNNITLEQVDAVAQAWNPSAYMIKYDSLFSFNRTRRQDYFYSIPDNLLRVSKTKRKIGEHVEMNFFGTKSLPKLYFIQHHNCHAANAFFLSNFKSSAILTCDFRGEFESTTFSIGNGNKIKKIKKIEMPNSLGMFYASITDLLGYKPDSDEWKVMAMAAFKNKDNFYVKKMKTLYKLTADGGVIFNKEFFRGENFLKPNLYTNNLIKLFGEKNFIEKRKEKFSEWHVSIAYALQKCSEEIAFHFINFLYKKTKSKNLCLGGGFFMNSVFNGKILKNTKFKNIYIPYAPTDSGNSIGAALYLNHCILNKKRKKINNSSLVGPKFTSQNIEKVLKRRKINYYLSKNIEKEVPELITTYGYIGHFYGESEFGDRALGNRSILGDPRKEKIKDKINSAIKYRESYRPFAPVTLDGHANKFFEVDKKFTSHYMEKVVKVKKNFEKKLGAIVHFDKSARIQTVDLNDNKRLWKILKNFEKLTNFPILLNTSFNVNGEPMVLNPDDAITTFFNSGLEVLVLNEFIIKKR